MMTVGSIKGADNNAQGAGFGANMQTDPVSRSIQNQIANKQKEMQELASDDKMTPEEKMKKRQEIQQEINSLNQQLRQHQITQRKEQQEKAASSKNETAENQKQQAAKAGKKENSLSQASMQAIISTDSSMKQAQVQGSAATQMKGRAGVLEIEIKQDEGRGGSTEAKKEELAEVQQRAEEAASAQMSTLAKANQTIKDVKEADSGKENESKDKKNNTGKVESKDKNDKIEENEKGEGEKEEKKILENTDTVEQEPQVSYTSIDIRL